MKNDTPHKLAKSLGLKRYQGVICPKGHSGIRYVVSMDCVKCRAIVKSAAGRRKRAERGPLPLGRPSKLVGPPKPKFIGPPKLCKKHPPKPVTPFDFWVIRIRKGSIRTKISVEYYKTLYVTHCPLLGVELTYKNCGQEAAPANYATLDKIDPHKGYTKGNMQILSYRANNIKNDATLDELKTMVKNWEGL